MKRNQLFRTPILLIPLLVAGYATGSENTLRLNKVEVSMHMVLLTRPGLPNRNNRRGS